MVDADLVQPGEGDHGQRPVLAPQVHLRLPVREPFDGLLQRACRGVQVDLELEAPAVGPTLEFGEPLGP